MTNICCESAPVPTLLAEPLEATALSDAIRQAILRELSRRERTIYWLSQQLPDVHRDTLYRFLNGTRGASTRVAGRILEVLDLRVVPGKEPKKPPKES